MLLSSSSPLICSSSCETPQQHMAAAVVQYKLKQLVTGAERQSMPQTAHLHLTLQLGYVRVPGDAPRLGC